ncbi:hypothetical protein L6R50_21335 [Myxococcota bacterium]|nr:hypothetical protein [Myxococcota bacterium]
MSIEMRIPEGWDEPSPFKWGETAQRVAERDPLLALVWRARQAAYWMARSGWRDELVLPDPNARPDEIGAWLLCAEDTAKRLDALTSAISGDGFTWGALTVRCDRIARVLVLHHVDPARVQATAEALAAMGIDDPGPGVVVRHDLPGWVHVRHDDGSVREWSAEEVRPVDGSAGAEQDLVTLESSGDDDGDGFAHGNGGRQEPDRHWEAR